ncbi:DUF1493 family protein [Larkinella sp. C7]|jgi:hypothetical protein|uniref:DUF1493 family protein n=1 Tax=Larkinella sp. C7 TaxID=2576607 RepID=UPI0011112AA3|nr:DUF1493 family protein [Larkinella sp. C7]
MNSLDQIKALVFELRGHYKFELTANTSLQKDLGIYGDDASEFIERFGQIFQVDISEFNYAKYFAGEGGIFTPWLTNWLKIDDDFGKEPLTLGDLEAAIESKKLR